MVIEGKSVWSKLKGLNIPGFGREKAVPGEAQEPELTEAGLQNKLRDTLQANREEIFGKTEWDNNDELYLQILAKVPDIAQQILKDPNVSNQAENSFAINALINILQGTLTDQGDGNKRALYFRTVEKAFLALLSTDQEAAVKVTDFGTRKEPLNRKDVILAALQVTGVDGQRLQQLQTTLVAHLTEQVQQDTAWLTKIKAEEPEPDLEVSATSPHARWEKEVKKTEEDIARNNDSLLKTQAIDFSPFVNLKES